MKFCRYCLCFLMIAFLAGCSATGAGDQVNTSKQSYDQLKKTASDLPASWTLAKCLQRAGSIQNWHIEEPIIEDFFKLGAVQLVESALLKKLDSPLPPDEKFSLQCSLTEIVKQRFQAASSLCRAMNIYPGHPITVDFVMPEKPGYPELPPLQDWEKAVVGSPYLKHLPVIDRVKIFRMIYVGMIAAEEKYSICRKNGKVPETATAYADFCTQLHKLCRLSGIQVEKFRSDLLQKKVIIIKPAP